MARIKRAQIRHTRRKKILKRAKGFHLGRSKQFRQAHEAVMKAEAQEYVGRKQRKRQFRRLWTQRINAGARQHGINYSRLIHGLKLAGVEVNRKMLADLAVREPDSFQAIVERAKAALSA